LFHFLIFFFNLFKKLFSEGRRDMILNIDINYGFSENSVINYTCNPFYNLIGQQYLHCLNGAWEQNIPKCILTENICRKKPLMTIESAKLIGLKSTTINDEYAFPYKTNPIKLYTTASYACPPGKKFSGIDEILIKYKNIGGRYIAYVNYSCNGKDKWEEVKCT